MGWAPAGNAPAERTATVTTSATATHDESRGVIFNLLSREICDEGASYLTSPRAHPTRRGGAPGEPVAILVAEWLTTQEASDSRKRGGPWTATPARKPR